MKEDRKIRQNYGIRPKEEVISRIVLKIMSNVAKISRTGTEKEPLALMRSLVVRTCEVMGVGAKLEWDEEVCSKEQAMVETLK